MREGVIGKFEVLAKVSRGGMAEVYRCRLRGIGGFEKTVAVKRIRAERASDPDFVSMFLDEARLAATLNHPNIVQVFEIGEVGGDPYIAMEYVDGPTFARLVRAARRSDRLHLGHVVKILSDVAAGLHHAHTAVGARGEPLGLVHRDVSPQNILVSREGVPKLLDFGVAKANGRLTETQAGTLKGSCATWRPNSFREPWTSGPTCSRWASACSKPPPDTAPTAPTTSTRLRFITTSPAAAASGPRSWCRATRACSRRL